MRVGIHEKFITVKKMKELLELLSDDLWLYAKSRADTGNIGIYKGTPGEELDFKGIIDLAAEEIDQFGNTEDLTSSGR